MNFIPDPVQEKAMTYAIELAARARGQTAPNPMVGALVISKAGDVIGEGFHARAGGPHAEVLAIQAAQKKTDDLSEAVLFVTLEPCNHFGKTAPCADLI